MSTTYGCIFSQMLTIMLGLMSLKASMTTLPFTDWMGSTTTATALKSDKKLTYAHVNRLNKKK